MGETTVLYVLTTLAQSCAALAAFVGAIGVFRLQMLRDQRIAAERELAAQAYALTRTDMHTDAILEHVELNKANPQYTKAIQARDLWRTYVPRLKQARSALIRLEAWTLVVIGASLVAFNFIPWLKYARWLPYALLLVVIATVAVTLWSVVVWTGKVAE